jgi:type III pantothenate kinase
LIFKDFDMDVIAIDVGNSAISLAVFIDDKLQQVEHLSVKQHEKLGGVIAAFRQACGPQPLGARTVPVVVSSVNPPITEVVAKIVLETLDQNILLIGRDIFLGMKVAVENSQKVGADRLLTAAAAFDVVNNAVVIADFGTATTIDCVNEHGIFLGGVIMPGLALSALSLREHTAALPEVPILVPENDYGVNTVSAIQAGIFFGAIGALREIVERYATLLGKWPHVVVTGGFSSMIAQKCDFIDSVVPNLCLTGLYLAYAKFRAAPETSADTNASPDDE